MISIAARLLRDELAAYLVDHQRNGSLTNGDIILENIANLEGENSNDLTEKVIISLVNIEEESTLKNSPNFVRKGSGSGEYVQPPVHVNLYFLFSSTYDVGTADAYEIALHRISLTAQFFQAKKKFNVVNSPFSSIAIAAPESISEQIKQQIQVTMELYTLTFEQINHLWGSLGGKQVPFLMYKARLVSIQDRISHEAPLIEHVVNDIISTADC